MLSAYRLGDLVYGFLTNDEMDLLVEAHPNSIGSEFIIEKRKLEKKYINLSIDNWINILTIIVKRKILQNINIFPKNISESIVIHLRLGDVIAGKSWHEKTKRPLAVNAIQSQIKKYSYPRYIIGKSFFAKTSSHNYDECIDLSNKYLKTAIDTLNAQHFDSGDADLDLCLAVMSKIFVRGQGYYSKLIVEIRNNIKLKNIVIC